MGEHLGFIFTALWSILIAFAMPNSKVFGKWLGWLGAAAGVGILLGTLEPVGVPYVGLVNAIAYSLWAIWIAIIGARIIFVEEK